VLAHNHFAEILAGDCLQLLDLDNNYLECKNNRETLLAWKIQPSTVVTFESEEGKALAHNYRVAVSLSQEGRMLSIIVPLLGGVRINFQTVSPYNPSGGVSGIALDYQPCKSN